MAFLVFHHSCHRIFFLLLLFTSYYALLKGGGWAYMYAIPVWTWCDHVRAFILFHFIILYLFYYYFLFYGVWSILGIAEWHWYFWQVVTTAHDDIITPSIVLKIRALAPTGVRRTLLLVRVNPIHNQLKFDNRPERVHVIDDSRKSSDAKKNKRRLNLGKTPKIWVRDSNIPWNKVDVPSTLENQSTASCRSRNKSINWSN